MLTLFSVFPTCSMYQKLVIISNFKVQEETPSLLGRKKQEGVGTFLNSFTVRERPHLPKAPFSQPVLDRVIQGSQSDITYLNTNLWGFAGGNWGTEIQSASPRRTQRRIETGFKSKSSPDPKPFPWYHLTSPKQVVLLSQQTEIRQCTILEYIWRLSPKA